jgi:hypothetical protein
MSLRSTYRLAGPPALLAILYIGLLLTTSAYAQVNFFDNRYLSPVYLPLLLALLILLAEAGSRFQERLKPENYNRLLFAVLTLLIAYSLVLAALGMVSSLSNGPGGYSTQAWQDSELVQYLRGNSDLADRPIYSNGPDAAYILSGLEASYSPGRERGTATPGQTRGWPESESYLIWFDRVERGYLFTLEELREMATIRSLARFSDGGVYTVSVATGEPAIR